MKTMALLVAGGILMLSGNTVGAKALWGRGVYRTAGCPRRASKQLRTILE
jgi:hypothetical protein